MKKKVFLWIFLFFPIVSFGQITKDTVEGWYVSANNGNNTRLQMAIVDSGIRGKAMLLDMELEGASDVAYISISKDYPRVINVPGIGPYFGMWRKILEASRVEDVWFGAQLTFDKRNPLPNEERHFSATSWNRSVHLGPGKGWDDRLTFGWRQDWYVPYEANFDRLTICFATYAPGAKTLKIKLLLDDINYCEHASWDGWTYDSVGKVLIVDIRSKYNVIFERFGDLPEVLGAQKLGNEIPDNFKLEQNYPNPFNPSTKIRFSLSKTESVSLVIYDALGREVETLVSESLAPGVYEKTWNAKNLASGIYFYKLTAGNQTQIKKMILSK